MKNIIKLRRFVNHKLCFNYDKNDLSFEDSCIMFEFYFHNELIMLYIFNSQKKYPDFQKINSLQEAQNYFNENISIEEINNYKCHK